MKILLVLLLVKSHFIGLLASPVSQVYDEYYDDEYEYGDGGPPPPPDIDHDKICQLPPELDYIGEYFHYLPYKH